MSPFEKKIGEKERRRHPRIDLLSLLAYACVDANNEIVKQGMGRTLNVSEGGILLETHLPMSSQYAVSMTIGLGDEQMDVTGRVIHSRQTEDGLFQTGIEFVNVDSSSIEILKAYVQAFEKLHEETGTL